MWTFGKTRHLDPFGEWWWPMIDVWTHLNFTDRAKLERRNHWYSHLSAVGSSATLLEESLACASCAQNVRICHMFYSKWCCTGHHFASLTFESFFLSLTGPRCAGARPWIFELDLVIRWNSERWVSSACLSHCWPVYASGCAIHWSQKFRCLGSMLEETNW